MCTVNPEKLATFIVLFSIYMLHPCLAFIKVSAFTAIFNTHAYNFEKLTSFYISDLDLVAKFANFNGVLTLLDLQYSWRLAI